MHNMHLLPGVVIQPNLELKTRPKQLLGSLPLAIALPAVGISNISLTVGRETGKTSPDKKDKKKKFAKISFSNYQIIPQEMLGYIQPGNTN